MVTRRLLALVATPPDVKEDGTWKAVAGVATSASKAREEEKKLTILPASVREGERRSNKHVPRVDACVRVGGWVGERVMMGCVRRAVAAAVAQAVALIFCVRVCV